MVTDITMVLTLQRGRRLAESGDLKKRSVVPERRMRTDSQESTGSCLLKVLLKSYSCFQQAKGAFKMLKNVGA